MPIAAGKYQVCLEYHIKNCAGPCVGYQDEASYNATIRQVEQLLNGKTQELTALLRDEMKRLAGEMRYEAAAELRDQVAALEKYGERQKVVSQDFTDRDFFALALDRVDDIACGVFFKVREGKVVGRQHKYIRRLDDRTEAALMQAFVEHYYTESTFFPEEVLLSVEPDNPEPLEEYLRAERGKKVTLRIPERGDKAGLMRMVEANARLLLEEWKLAQAKREGERVPHAVQTLQRDLRLKHLPARIECFDIST
jgi:excinuclease ABC subunit C